ncbi:tail fiber assembly protein [Providencia rettgeri]|uniref:tail fiber assembly protein n=1 Tax=Providencia rettgeri TaxID=587 RepID=UPI0025A702AD|nr:tail fiber assembly protein [Providencia rettgeri]ELR5224518.1 tail fiber assembly protein [Providencia rettgeri]MDX7324658.1 tail fiber assembly protein [Providencia rettgeri]
MYRFNADDNSFYSHELKDYYINAGVWPENGVDIDDDVRNGYLIKKEGFVVGSDKNGHPKWVKAAPKSKEQYIAEAEMQKQLCAEEAEKNITILERKVRLNMATEADKNSLTAWEIYSIKIADIDTSQAPDVTYPPKP